MKRIFLDIETSPLLVCSWAIGRKISLTYENIVSERKIICIGWKIQGESKVHALNWQNGDDKKMLRDFISVINGADELVGHNIRAYDLPWIKARCMFHQIPSMPDYKVVDTLTMARSNFRFACNRLDYLGQFLGLGAKTDTGGFGLWRSVVLDKSEGDLKKMVSYCKNDVRLLEKVYDRLVITVPHKTHAGVFAGEPDWSCANCASHKVNVSKTKVSAQGSKKYQMQCRDCGIYYTINEASHKRYLKR